MFYNSGIRDNERAKTMNNQIYQVSTLQALMLGYTKKVTTVEEFVKHGDIGIGTFENIDGEMILLDGQCYQACEDGHINKAPDGYGIPFATCKYLKREKEYELSDIGNIEQLRVALNNKIDEDFALNSMHVLRIDGEFESVSARSEGKYESEHIKLKQILKTKQKDFVFNNVKGTLVGMYFPDYMNGINAAGWHLHFISEDRTTGGHVFDVNIKKCKVYADRVTGLELRIPDTPAFDTYDFRDDSSDDIDEVELGKK